MQKGSRHGLSQKNPYRLPSRNREYELIYFCLQYPEWKRDAANFEVKATQDEWSDPTGELAMQHYICKKKIELVERIAKDAGGDIYEFLLKGITEGRSYNNLRSFYSMPCGHDKYFNRYHKFFYLLSQEKHMF